MEVRSLNEGLERAKNDKELLNSQLQSLQEEHNSCVSLEDVKRLDNHINNYVNNYN